MVQVKEMHEADPRIPEILSALHIPSLEAFTEVLDRLLGAREQCEIAELEYYADRAHKAKNIANSLMPPSRDELLEVFKQSLG
jgi:hypothetical protein